jgi:hypothetical protein
MNIKYKTVLAGDYAIGKESRTAIRIVDAIKLHEEDPCCAAMMSAISNDIVIFDYNYNKLYEEDSDIMNVDFGLIFELCDPEGDSYSSSYLRYYPFCGEKIALIHTDTETYVLKEEIKPAEVRQSYVIEKVLHKPTD